MEDIDDLAFNFDKHAIIAGIVFGILGWYLFSHGRKKANNRNVVVGLLLMLYPYFVSGPWLNWGIGMILSAYAYYWWDKE